MLDSGMMFARLPEKPNPALISLRLPGQPAV